MSNTKIIWKVACMNFSQWKRNPRVVLTFILAFVMCLMLSANAVEFADSYGKSLQLLEAFMWSFGDSNSILISVLLLVFLLMDMPFINQGTPYALIRINRAAWVAGQILYVVLAVCIYMFFLLCASALICAPISFKENMWSEAAALLGYSGIGNKVALPASLKAMEMSTPYVCTAWVFLLVFLYAILNATLMMAFNIRKSKAAGILSVFALNIYGLLLNPEIFMQIFKLPEALAYKASLAVGWFSPLNHATYYMHNFGYDYLPKLWVSVFLFLAFIALNVCFIYKGIHKYEFCFAQVKS